MRPGEHIAVALTVLMTVCSTVGYTADDDRFGFLQSDRLEVVDEEDALVWDVQGFWGDDHDKLWLKAEGGRANGQTDDNEIQLLWSHAQSPFFDRQIGLRHDAHTDTTYAVAGLQGLAPQWFEVDAALFVSEHGDVSARMEVEYDWLLTQRLVLQSRAEIEIAAGDAPQTGVRSGLVHADLGLRLRYEFRREIAPYVGVEWRRDRLASQDSSDEDSTTLLLGLRLWF